MAWASGCILFPVVQMQVPKGMRSSSAASLRRRTTAPGSTAFTYTVSQKRRASHNQYRNDQKAQIWKMQLATIYMQVCSKPGKKMKDWG